MPYVNASVKLPTDQPTSRKPNPSSAPRHTKPERQRNKSRHLAPGHCVEFVHHRHAPFDRKREEENQKQRRHLYPERKTVVTLGRFGNKKRNTRREHHRQASQ